METDKILHETADNIVNKFLKMLEFRPFKCHGQTEHQLVKGRLRMIQ